MISLWERAIESNKALLLDEKNLDLGPDDLLKKVEEFDGVSQATEHSYSALVLSSEDGTRCSMAEGEVDFQSDNYDEDDLYPEDDIYYDTDSSDLDATVPLGSLPVDEIAEKLKQKRI